MKRELHARFCEGGGVQFPSATRLVAHCATETQAQQVLESIQRRLAQCRLDVHPVKTLIVYCKDDDRPRHYPQERFDFLGYSVPQEHTDKEFTVN